MSENTFSSSEYVYRRLRKTDYSTEPSETTSSNVFESGFELPDDNRLSFFLASMTNPRGALQQNIDSWEEKIPEAKDKQLKYINNKLDKVIGRTVEQSLEKGWIIARIKTSVLVVELKAILYPPDETGHFEAEFSSSSLVAPETLARNSTLLSPEECSEL